VSHYRIARATTACRRWRALGAMVFMGIKISTTINTARAYIQI